MLNLLIQMSCKYPCKLVDITNPAIIKCVPTFDIEPLSFGVEIAIVYNTTTDSELAKFLENLKVTQLIFKPGNQMDVIVIKPILEKTLNAINATHLQSLYFDEMHLSSAAFQNLLTRINNVETDRPLEITMTYTTVHFDDPDKKEEEDENAFDALNCKRPVTLNIIQSSKRNNGLLRLHKRLGSYLKQLNIETFANNPVMIHRQLLSGKQNVFYSYWDTYRNQVIHFHNGYIIDDVLVNYMVYYGLKEIPDFSIFGYTNIPTEKILKLVNLKRKVKQAETVAVTEEFLPCKLVPELIAEYVA